MEPLATNRRVMMWFCMCPADESTSKKERMFHVAFIFIVATITLCALISSVVSVIVYMSTDFESSLYAVFQVAAEASAANLIIVAFFMRDRIKAIFTKLSDIYAAGRDRKNLLKMIFISLKSRIY